MWFNNNAHLTKTFHYKHTVKSTNFGSPVAHFTTNFSYSFKIAMFAHPK